MISSSEIVPANDAPLPRRVYVASPITTYHTARYDLMLNWITTHFPPQARLVAARDLYTSTNDWLRRWPNILAMVDAVCVFTDEDGWIGRGVWTEMRDAELSGLPVRVIGDDGTLHTLDDARVLAIDPEDWRQYARLYLPGDPSLIEVR